MPDACVLVVEDDAAIRRLMSSALERSSIKADTAADGAEAMRLLQQREYSAVLLDLMMPNGNGFDVLQFMRDNEIPAPVIVVSAAGERMLHSLDRKLVKLVVQKPFDVHEVVATVRVMCGLDQTAGQSGAGEREQDHAPLS